MSVCFGGVTPILRVADFDASIGYYVEKLGFSEAWRAGKFGCVRRDEVEIFLCEGSQGSTPTWIYVGVSDADALHDELRTRGAKIRHPPANFPWGSRELHVFDLDGHVLRCGSEAPKGEPLGPWLDEDGTRWMPRPDGTWEKVE